MTVALMTAGILTSAHAQLQTAGDLLVNVNATASPAGPLTSIANSGTLGGFFEARGGAAMTPSVLAAYSTGTKGISFNGVSYLQLVQNLGDPSPLAAPAGLVGANPTTTVEAWVLNPWIAQEETVVSWGKRGGPDGTNKSLNYGWDARWGSIGHWGSPDIGWDPCCNDGSNPPLTPAAGVWHHLVWTYDGTTTRVYSDGVLKNSETVGLNTAAGPTITIAAQHEGDGVTVTGGLRGNLNIARLRIHDEALTGAQVLNNYDFEKADFSNGDPSGAPLATGPIHEYRFSNPAGAAAANAVISDSVGTAHGNIRGSGASYTGRRLVLPGGGSGTAPYADLPNGLLSRRSADNAGSGQITIEGFVKVTGSRTWARIFDFGSSASAEVPGVGGGGEGTDYLTYTAQNNNDVNFRQLETRNVDAVGGTAGGGNLGHPTATFNQDFHFVVTWNEATGEQTVFENGKEINSRIEGARLSGINDVNVWLGRSQWNGDANMQGEFDRFSIYDRVLSDGEVLGNYVRGAEAGLPASIISQPQNITVSLPNPATFSIVAGGEKPTSYQWYRGGVAIPGATGSSYTTAATSLADNSNPSFYCVAQNSVGGVPQPPATSATATLTVIEDLFPPTIVSSRAPINNPTQFDVVFSEPVNAADAGNLANYSSSGFTINSIAVQNATTVRFTCSSLNNFICKTLTVNNIRDLAVAQNVIAANTVAGVLFAVGTVRYEQFNVGGGVNPADLINNPAFPNSPNVVQNVTQFENPAGGAGQGDNYGARIIGFLSPPVSGAYIFYNAADDGAILWLSTDANPANKVQIAREPIWSTFRSYTGGGGGGGGRVCPGAACNISPPVVLQAGCRYFIEYIYKEGGGGDYGSVAWQTPASGPSPNVPNNGSAPIQGAFLSPFEIAPNFSPNLASVTVSEGRILTLNPGAFGTSPLTFQWYRDGVAIAGATGPTYTTDVLKFPADNGATFYMVAQNGFGTVQSATATVTVLFDSTPPAIVGLQGSADFLSATVIFNEPVDNATGSDPFSYTLTDSGGGSLSVNTATVSADGFSVLLATDMQAENTLYTLTVDGVTDRAFVANTLTGGIATFRSWVLGGGGVKFELYTQVGGGTDINILVNHPTFPNSPDEVRQLTTFDTGPDIRENYGGRVRGLFIPPVSGAWNLFVTADDGSRLFFNPNGPNAANKVLISEETPGCCTGFAGRQTGPFNLTAGVGYYLEGIFKEAGGGDYIRVAARLASDTTTALAPMPAAWTGYPAAPAGVGGPLTISQQPANQSVFEQTIYTFTVVASNPNGLPISYQWRRDGADIAGANGPSYSALAALTDSGATFSVAVSMIGAKDVSGTATLTVNPDVTAPLLVSATGGDFFTTITVRYNELMGPSASDNFNYTVSGGVLVTAAALQADGMNVLLTLDVTTPLAEDTDYTVTVSGVTDRATSANEIAPGSTISFHSFKFAPRFLNMSAFFNFPGASLGDMDAMIASPRYPDSPNERKLLTALDSTTAGGAYANNSIENYGARITGLFVPPVSGNWILYLRSDDASRLYLNPAGIDPAGRVLLTEEAGCCGNFAGHASAPQALTAGTRYYIEAIYKEGGGGDYVQVAAKLDTDPRDPNTLTAIPGSQLGAFIPVVPTTLAISQQPVNVNFFIDPLNPGGAAGTLLSEDFNSGNGGFAASGAPAAFTGAFAYDAPSGSWQVNASDAEIGVPYTSRLQSPVLTVTKTGRARLTLAHRWSVETPGDFWDGNQVRVSVNGGAFVAVPASAFTSGGYNGTVRPSNSILTGQQAWVENSPGHAAGTFVTSVAELGVFNAGDTVRIELLYAGDTNTRGTLLPSWQINSVGITEGGQDPVLRVTATVNPNQTIYYQWQRNNGAGFFDVPGASGPSLTLSPTLGDNGATFRALVFVPGASVTSSTASLTVIQLNTAPSFTAGPSQTVLEDSGSHVVPWATGISPHSIGRVPITYGSDFSGPAPGATLYGVAVVTGGNLQLTTAANSLFGAFYSPAVPGFIESYNIEFTAYVGGGTCCGDPLGGGATTAADGFSVNVATDLPVPAVYGNPGEEGAGSGLTVQFDTWDNGGGEAPALEVEYNSAMMARLPLNNPHISQGMAAPRFIPVRISVSPLGTVDVDYDGTNALSGVVLTGYGPRTGLRLGFGARTGGANDNHWIDNLLVQAFPVDASSAEAGQTVQFIVSNNNPSLFIGQPAIAPDGTLTYRSAANANGVATVTVVAKDNGGTVGGGKDTSAPVTFTITVTPVNDCPTVATAPISVLEDTPTPIPGAASDVDGDALVWSYTPPAHGTLSGVPPSLVYTPALNYNGPDGFILTVSDGQCSASGTVAINVLPVNDTPIAKITATGLADFSPGVENQVLISCDGEGACVNLDGSLSSDVESPAGSLTYQWFVGAPPVQFASGVTAVSCLELGTHTIRLAVTDPQGATGEDLLTIDVLTAGEAIEELINKVNDSTIARKNKRPFIASLKAAAASSERGQTHTAANQLHAFQNKVRAQVSKDNPADATVWIRWAQQIIDGLNRCE